MNWLALIVFVFGIIWLAKGQRAAFSFLPGMFVFLIGEMLIWSFLKPSTYPGDFFDTFLPIITIPIGVILSIPLLFAARYVARKTSAAVNQPEEPKEPLPLLSTARLPGLLVVILAAGMFLLGDRLEEQSREAAEKKLP